ncbi:polymer-forming cytoskeletal protein [Streptococcus suis]|uniref:polymer-forming cytoskeletal protein n=1 Tax=Streptococcus suis TaxID=1307 RepID=UPI0015837E49|nr:polymer-forming cytoskeletal protein [Streptococcus suis]
MTKKYELVLDDTISFWGWKLFRIRALISFGSVEVGDLGGYIQKEENLSHDDNAWVWGNAKVSGDAEVWGNAKVSELGDIIVFKNHWSSGRHFTYTKSNKMWKVGCFYGTGQELIKKAYRDSEKSGNYYKAYVDFVETLERLSEE